MRTSKTFYIPIFIFLFYGTQIFGAPEIWLKVLYSDLTYLSTSVQIYRESNVGTGYLLLYDVESSDGSITHNGANAFCDMIYSEDTENTTWPALEYEATYLIKIQNKYCKIEIDAYQLPGSPDITITYISGGSFSSVETPPYYKIDMTSEGNWDVKSVTVKNNFAGGKLKIEEIVYDSVGISGVSDNYGSPTFPHTIKAYDNQTPPDNYKRIFGNWTSNQGYNNSNLQGSIQSVDATYTANFAREFNINFENNFTGLSNSGTMSINSSTVSLPHSAYPVKETFNIQANALYQIINGIQYTFSYWSDGTSNYYTASQTFTPDNHKTYKAYFTGKPHNSYRNLTITSPVGQPVAFSWSEHPNTNVTQYKIYRKVKHNGVWGAEVLKATKLRGNTSYTDNEYIRTSSPNDVLEYDVRAYYSTESSYADVDFVTLYGMEFAKKNVAENVIPFDYSISNYPNPFNPSTLIKFSIPEEQNVRLTIYNMLGEKIKELVNGRMETGQYSYYWNGDNEQGNKVISGVYLSVLETREKRLVQKMILSK